MVVHCEEVWLQISDYVDESIDPDLRPAMDEHIRGCARCTSVLAGTRNVVRLFGDERMVETPLGYSHRLHRRLEENMPRNSRRLFLGWAVAAAAGLIAAAGFEIARSSQGNQNALRSEQAQPGKSVPPDLMVVILADGKLFHVPECGLIQGKPDLERMPARDAMKKGYTPCARCLKEYLSAEVAPKFLRDRGTGNDTRS